MKSVLVIDTPEQCCECVMGMFMCIGIASKNYNPDIGALNEKCPLKDMPKHLSMVAKGTEPNYALGYETGWNAVLDYLMMGEDDGD